MVLLRWITVKFKGKDKAEHEVLKHIKGMTLIEVLIAQLFCSLQSVLSFVSRSMLLHESRLERAIDRALLAELIKEKKLPLSV